MEEIFKAPKREELVQRWIKFANLKQNEDGTYDCNENVLIADSIILTKSRKFAIKFNHVHGNFNCSKIELNSLEGCPRIVDGNFDCTSNNLISLKGAPKKVNGNFDSTGNKKKFTEQEVKAVCDVGGKIYAYTRDGTFSWS